MHEAAKRRAASLASAPAEQLAFLFRDTQVRALPPRSGPLSGAQDQFRNFYILKTHLENPSHMKKQLLFQLPPAMERIVTNKCDGCPPLARAYRRLGTTSLMMWLLAPCAARS